jgi:hypothetical protein
MAMTILLPLLAAAAAVPADAAAERAAVMRTVDALFAGIGARDAAAIAATEYAPGGGATVAVEKDDGSRTITHRSWPEVNARFAPGPERYAETMTDPTVLVDGDIAMVWGRYSFSIDGKLHHCGVDHFDLVREAGQWKIANLSWTQRTTGCAQ